MEPKQRYQEVVLFLSNVDEKFDHICCTYTHGIYVVVHAFLKSTNLAVALFLVFKFNVIRILQIVTEFYII